MIDVKPAAIRENSVLFVTDAFGTLISSHSAASAKASLTDGTLAHDAAAYEQLVLSLAQQDIDVTVLFVSDDDMSADRRFEAIQTSLAEANVKLLNVAPSPMSVGLSVSVQRAYSVYRYLTAPGNNVYATIQAPSHSGLLYYVLQARHQGLACFDQTSFVAHLDTLPRAVLERLENADPEGLSFGKTYGGSETQIAEMLKTDYIAQKMVEMADSVVVQNQDLSDYVSNELGWQVDAEKVRVAPAVPVMLKQLASQKQQQSGDLELVFVGTPYLGIGSGVKVVADALDLLKGRVSENTRFHVTFLGQPINLPNPKLSTDEFLDLRAYNWPSADWKVVSVSSVQDTLAYFASGTSATSKVAVVPHILNSPESAYILKTLVANNVAVLSSRSSMTEAVVSYSDWSSTLFQSNSSKALADKLLSVIGSPASVQIASLNQEISVAQSANAWVDSVYSSLFDESKKGGMCQNNVWSTDASADLPLVSIVIVHHDRVSFLKQALKSIEAQTYPEDRLEVILVDDGSTDPEAVQFINDLAWQWWETKGWKVVREPQRWLGAARNTGVKYAKGEYVIFMDDDDVSKDFKVELLTKVAMNTNADVVTAGHDLFSSKMYPQTAPSAKARGRFVPVGPATSAGMFQNVFGDASFLVKKTFFVETGGFTEDFGVGFEDYEFFAKAALDPQARFEAIPESLTWYRKLADGKSMTDNTELKQNQIRMMRPYVEKYPMQSPQEQSLLRFAQDRLFLRNAIDNPFAAALLNTTASLQSITTINQATTILPGATTILNDVTTVVPSTTVLDVTTVVGGTTQVVTGVTTVVQATTVVDLTTALPPVTSVISTTRVIPVPSPTSCVRDRGGVCNGDGNSCVDCAGIVFGTAKRDRCNVCNGDGSSCFTLLEIIPDPIVNQGGVEISLLGAGFVAGIQVFINNVEIASNLVRIRSNSVVSVTIPARTPFDDFFEANPGVDVSLFDVFAQIGSQTSPTVKLTVYRQVSEITAVTPDETVMSDIRPTIFITGTRFLNFPDIACWFTFTELGWTADFSARAYVTYYETTAATFVSSTTITCPGPLLTESSDVVVDISYSGWGYDGYDDGVVTLSFGSYVYVPKNQNAPTTITVVAPSPQVTASYMTDDGLFTVIEFDSDTNGFDLTNEGCGSLFVVDPQAEGLDTAIYAKLSDGVEDDCGWFFEDPATLLLSVSADVAANNPTTVLAPGKRVRFLPNLLSRSSQRYKQTFSGDSLVIGFPANPVSPEVHLLMPVNLGVCSPLEIDLSTSAGSSGRFFSSATFTADYLSAPGSAAEQALRADLALFASEVPDGVMFHEVPETAFGASSRIRFSFTLENFLGKSSTITFDLEYDSATAIPMINIVGPVGNRATRSTRVRLQGLVSFNANSDCLTQRGINPAGAVDMDWDMLGDATQLSIFSRSWISPSGADLNIPPYFFDANVDLDFELTVTMPSTGASYAVAYSMMYVPESFTVDVAGGSKIISSTAPLPLDVVIADSNWADNTELISHLGEYSFNWTCSFRLATGEDAQCFTIAGVPLQLEAMKSFTIAANSLRATGNGNSYYSFTVTVLHTTTGRTASASALIRVLNKVVPRVQLTSTRTRPSAYDSSFALRATVENAANFNNGLRYTWISQPTCDGASFATVDLSAANLATAPNTNVLAFRTTPPVLAAGTSYCIQVVVRDPTEADGVFGAASLRFTTRREPDGGSCRVIGNNTGSALETEFRFRCGEWNTDTRSGDISYTFSLLNTDGSKLALGPKTRSGIFTYIFGAVGTFTIVADISDDVNAFSRTPPTFQVTVTPGTTSIDDFLARQNQNFKNSKNVNDALKGVGAGSMGLSNGGNGKVKRQNAATLQTTLLNSIQSIMDASVVDHSDIGPVLTNLLRSVTNAGTVQTSLILPATRMLQKISVDMNKNGRDVRSCYSVQVARDVLTILNVLTKSAETAAGFNSTAVFELREPILQAFTACLQRMTVCGGNPSTYSTDGNTVTFGTLPSSSGSNAFGVFVVPNSAGGLNVNSGDCVSYRYDNGNNYLPDVNGTIGNKVYILDFRSASANAGGLRRGEVSNVPTPGTDLLIGKFDPPITITLPIDSELRPAIENKSYTPECSFYRRSATDFNQGYWDDTGCTVESYTSSQVVCKCSHLTEYAISITRVPSSVTPPTKETPTNPDPNNPANATSNIGAIVGSIAVVATVLALVGFFAYKRVERTKAFDASRVVPLPDTAFATPDPQPTRQDPKIDGTTDANQEPKPDPKLVKIRDPTLLPAYQLPPSYDDHMAAKTATNAETNRQEKLY